MQTARGAVHGGGYFVLHYFEMCIPMCVGFAVGDLLYFWAAGQLGHSEPFSDLPEVSVLVITPP